MRKPLDPQVEIEKARSRIGQIADEIRALRSFERRGHRYEAFVGERSRLLTLVEQLDALARAANSRMPATARIRLEKAIGAALDEAAPPTRPWTSKSGVTASAGLTHPPAS